MSLVHETCGALSRSDLHGYQRHAVDFVLARKRCALWVEMGLGKTAIVLTALSDLVDRFEIGRVLVIAPLRVAVNTWPSEVERWAHLTHLPVQVLCGPKAKREHLARSDRSLIHVINRENVPWLVDFLGPENWPYDVVVIDEASSFKSPSAQRFKKLRSVIHKSARVTELTGTPASNGLLDIWSQIFLLDRGERLGKTFTGFKMNWFESDYSGYSWTPRKGTPERIHERLKSLCLTLKAEDYLDLPSRIDQVIEVDMPPKARRGYDELERHFIVELENETITAAQQSTLVNKLLQCSNGAVYAENAPNFVECHDAKIQALRDIVAEMQGQPLLVAYNFKSDKQRILAALGAEAHDLSTDTGLIDKWNRGEIPVLLAHPASAGHGLNLQHGGNTIVWFGLNWSLELYQQFNARLHRQGQSRPVIVHHLVARDTVDATVLKALESKDATQTELLNAMRADIGRRAA